MKIVKQSFDIIWPTSKEEAQDALIREWLYIFELRTSPQAHPHMQALMNLALPKVANWFSPLFEGLL